MLHKHLVRSKILQESFHYNQPRETASFYTRHDNASSSSFHRQKDLGTIARYISRDLWSNHREECENSNRNKKWTYL